MKRQRVSSLLIAGSLASLLAACSTAQTTPTSVPAVANQQQAQPTAAIVATIAPLTTAAAGDAAANPLASIVTGSGEIRTSRDADLTFLVPGVVAEVRVKEGDQVKAGDVLAILDTRTFDLDIQRAEAGIAAAQSQQGALVEGPRAADIAAADAQVRQAQAQLAQAQAGVKEQDITQAQAGLNAALANLQATRDRLSAGKTQAELALEQAANQLRNAQDAYSRIYWENRRIEDQLNRFGQELPQAAKDQEASALRAVQSAEAALEQARVNLESARQGEVTGIQAAEQQVTQAQAQLERLQLPPDADRVAAARAALEAARAQRARLNPDPRASQQQQVGASLSQAEVALELAKINRERAELKAPFDGTIAVVNLDPGDPSQLQGRPAIQIVDVSNLRVDVQISDADIARVQVGQKADVRVDAIPEKVFTGTVTFIAPTATNVGNVRNYLVRITLDSQDGLRAGMSTRVEIKV